MGHALARTVAPSQTSGASQYLTFTLGSELYAVPIASIREVVEFHGLTEIPLTSPVVPGVLNLRGSVVPVIDLSARFGRPSSPIGRRTCVIVVETRVDDAREALGVIVDSVSEALEVDESQIEQRPAFGAGLRADFVAGMLKLAGRFVVVLDLAQLLSIAELEQLVTDSALAAEGGNG
ncbi:MAG TPA: chemotaxis protein CheW [Polyangiales bacterium]|nr:chemotaxis protein CheW [Polyangiales bacterium]